MSLQKFSVTVIPKKVRIYKLNKQSFNYNFKLIIKSENIMCQTFIEDEITIYKYTHEQEDKSFENVSESFDIKTYNIINIHEDIPGIDHIGIVNYISGIFSKQKIPLLYINTYSYNLILIADDFIESSIKLLKNIANF
jgi:hypothetical protein